MIQATEPDMRLTNSRKNSAQTCLRKHYYAYELGIRRHVDAQPLRFGTAIHLGLDLWKTGSTPEEAIIRAIEEYDNSEPADMGENATFAWKVEREKIRQLLNGYFWRWAEMPLEWVSSEQIFNIPLVNPETSTKSRTFTLAGKVDGICNHNDQVTLVEHKTTSSDIAPESDYWRRCQMDSQLSVYWMAGKELGYDIENVIYDVIRKPATAPNKIPLLDKVGFKIVHDAEGKRVMKKDGFPRQSPDKAKGYIFQSRLETPEEYGERLRIDIGERPEFYYARREFVRLNADLEEAQYDFWQEAAIIRDCKRFDRWPRSTGACIGFGKCAYFDLCTSGFDHETDILPEGFTVIDNVHQELE